LTVIEIWECQTVKLTKFKYCPILRKYKSGSVRRSEENPGLPLASNPFEFADSQTDYSANSGSVRLSPHFSANSGSVRLSQSEENPRPPLGNNTFEFTDSHTDCQRIQLSIRSGSVSLSRSEENPGLQLATNPFEYKLII
jgi:hypothetical protein